MLSIRLSFCGPSGRFGQRDEKQAAAAVSHGRWARALTAGVQSLNMPREFTEVIAT